MGSLDLNDPEVIEYIKTNLCDHDLRNPNHLFHQYGETDTPMSKPENCYCDNCFYGRTQLAEKLLEYVNENSTNQ